MKRFQSLAFALALSAIGLVEAPAQEAYTEEQMAAIMKAVEERRGEAAAKSGGTRGRDTRSAAPAARGGAAPNSVESGWAAALAAGRARQESLGVKTQQRAGNQGGGGASSWEDFLLRGGGGVAMKTVDSTIQEIIKKQITVIAGERVTDAVTGELLDDAREIRVDEDKKDEYYDDGTHGDLVAGDGQYTRIEEVTGVIGPNNQRIKEQLIQALYEASRLDAREFYGHTIMSTDHSTRPERNVRWALVDASEDRVGFRISEIATEKTVEMPDFWAEEASRDVKIAGPNGWARSFLDEYRVEKGGLTSDFYPPYVPNPPTIPKTPPPSAEGWTPFVESYDPDAETVAGGRAGPGRGGLGAGSVDAVGLAEAFANRGAGKGSTSGGYFKGR